MLQLLMRCVVFEVSDQTTNNSQRAGNLLRHSQVGSGFPEMRSPMTVIIDTDQITSDDNKIATLVSLVY